jgi:hypothetical protein
LNRPGRKVIILQKDLTTLRELPVESFGGGGNNTGDLTLGEAESFADLGLGEILVEEEVNYLF